ncbi:MAG: DUF2147 domain-containing protein [Sphingomonas sp.]|jgi:uncharacterized protein (DUF2147 family)|uniref:DUF2147 domain-containing protein n=1 Tax=Sphingomonas hominis TaxID=2741495 RepID=A0ABX2JIY1_9SPHN|nr:MULTISPECIES: DUF2147 domain-containing protein [Sphingomonas]MDK2770270.1 DUF2147 domain-containing protein [Sphingomonas sp.]NTS66382.1 DUF2147 domain-containing protein [Sphingomonas hominis]PZU76627.1 MAG: DUF2147 domain-containing protein [Sphingomonas sp.]
MSMMLLALALMAGNPPAETVIGRWRTETRGGVVDIQRCGASICGRLVSSDKLRRDPTLKDGNNRDAAQRDRPLRGLLMLSGFSRDGEVWSGGRIYNADDGKTYGAKLTPIGRDQLKVRGCVFVPLCKTQTWTRIP